MVSHPYLMNAAQSAVIITGSILVSQRIAALPTVDWVEVVVGVVVSVAWITPIMLAWFQVNYALSPPPGIS
jgi:hypothetical protein